MSFRGWVTFSAASQADAKSRTAEPRRVFCAARMFELSDRELEELWPGLERLLNTAGLSRGVPGDLGRGPMTHANKKSKGQMAMSCKEDAGRKGGTPMSLDLEKAMRLLTRTHKPHLLAKDSRDLDWHPLLDWRLSDVLSYR